MCLQEEKPHSQRKAMAACAFLCAIVQLCVCACGAEHFLDCSDWNSKSLNVFSSLKPIISEGNELGVDNRV